MEDPRYPIGKLEAKEHYTPAEIDSFIKRIESVPSKFEAELASLSDTQLDTPYREDGWTLRQVIHHVADSHMNAYVRLKWALTEDSPTIKAYEEKSWAETAETQAHPSVSISLLKALHTKMALLAGQLTTNQLMRKFTHPQTQRQVRLDQLLGTYAWHGEHHLAHITSLKKKMGWK